MKSSSKRRSTKLSGYQTSGCMQAVGRNSVIDPTSHYKLMFAANREDVGNLQRRIEVALTENNYQKDPHRRELSFRAISNIIQRVCTISSLSSISPEIGDDDQERGRLASRSVDLFGLPESISKQGSRQ